MLDVGVVVLCVDRDAHRLYFLEKGILNRIDGVGRTARREASRRAHDPVHKVGARQKLRDWGA